MEKEFKKIKILSVKPKGFLLRLFNTVSGGVEPVWGDKYMRRIKR
jgi:hypothetical protein